MSVNFTVKLRARWDKGNPNDGFPIYLATSFDGVKNPTFKKTGIYVASKDEWDAGRQVIKQRRDKDILQAELNNQKTTQFNFLLSQKITGQQVTKATIKKKGIKSLFDYIRSVRGDNEWSAQCISHIKAFHGSEPSLQDITREWLRLFQSDYFEKKLKLQPNTIRKSMKVLRRVTNQAAIERYIDEPLIGKGRHEMPEEPVSDRTYLVKEERECLVEGLFSGKYDNNPSVKKTLTYFLLCCYSGLRFSDAKRFRIAEHVEGPIMKLTAQKNGNWVIYRHTKTLRLLFALIESEVGVLTQNKDTYGTNLKTIQKDFEIDKDLTGHVGRHSFGTMMAENDVSIQHCAYYLAIDVKTCEIYYHLTGKIVNDQNMHLQDL